MTTGATVPDREAFAELVRDRRVVPVTRRLLADGETPIGAYRKLARGRPGTFLLESAEHGGVWSRYSFVGVRSAATLVERGGIGVWEDGPDPARGRYVESQPPHGEEAPDRPNTDGDPLAMLRRTAAALRTESRPGLPPLTGGLVGYLGYDAVRRLERLPSRAEDDLGIPELMFLVVTDLAVLDHSDGSILLIANVLPGDSVDAPGAYDEALSRLDDMVGDLATAAEPTVATLGTAAPSYAGRTSRDDYLAAVQAAREHIRAGDAFQIVLSQRFETAASADALDVYRVLRASNPSPYMYLLRCGELDVVGSSPEALVKVTNGRARMHPIAGTRRRGSSPEEDARLAAQLLADPKERSEHVMLVDLGRNDLGRVCVPGSVDVVDFMAVERYSHVMHLVSTVVGEVLPELSAYDVLAACFPAGTLSGAPKVRAMQIIEELEPTRRGLYGGAVGYLGFSGDLDTAIAIRTAVLRDGRAFVQAGAGIVADSDPATEDAECRSKAAAVLSAIAAAATLRPAAPG